MLTVGLSLFPTAQSSSSEGGSSEGLLLLVELWRTDLVTSVVELDSEGNVMGGQGEHDELEELYPPGKGGREGGREGGYLLLMHHIHSCANEGSVTTVQDLEVDMQYCAYDMPLCHPASLCCRPSARGGVRRDAGVPHQRFHPTAGRQVSRLLFALMLHHVNPEHTLVKFML
jgi:hypothetical protein